MTDPQVRPDSEQLRAFEELMHYEGAAAFAAGPAPWEYWNNGDLEHAWPENIESTGHRLISRPRHTAPARPLGQRVLATLTNLTLLVLVVGIAGVWISAGEDLRQVAQGVQPAPIALDGAEPATAATPPAPEQQLAKATLPDIEALPAPAAGPDEDSTAEVGTTLETPFTEGEPSMPAAGTQAPLFAPPTADELWSGQIHTGEQDNSWAAPPIGLEGVLPFEPEAPAEYQAPGAEPKVTAPAVPAPPRDWAPTRPEMAPAETVGDMPTADAGGTLPHAATVTALDELPGSASGTESGPVAATGLVDTATPEVTATETVSAGVTADEVSAPPLPDTAAGDTTTTDILALKAPALEATPPAPRADIATVNAAVVTDAPQWVVNLAAYNSENIAQRMLEKFREQGVETELFHITVNGKDMVRLRTTGLDSYQEATDWSALLEERLGLNGTWVSKR